MIVKRDKGGGGNPYINGNNCSHIHAYKHNICGGFSFCLYFTQLTPPYRNPPPLFSRGNESKDHWHKPYMLYKHITGNKKEGYKVSTKLKRRKFRNLGRFWWVRCGIATPYLNSTSTKTHCTRKTRSINIEPSLPSIIFSSKKCMQPLQQHPQDVFMHQILTMS